MNFKTSSAICFNLDQSKTLSSGNGLIDTNEIYFSDRIENIVEKGENAGNHYVFQRLSSFGVSYTHNCV